MNLAEQVADRLSKWMRRSSPLSVRAFHLFVDEAEQRHTRLGRSRQITGELTLFWEDGSVSLHDVTEALAADGEWPVLLWREARFFAPGRERLLQLSTPELPPVPVYDPIVAESVQTGRLPHVPDGLEAAVRRERRTVLHSRGMCVAEETTACTWTAAPGVPVRCESRRWPTPKLALYLQMEAAWYQSHPVAEQGGSVSPSAHVLFAPPAFRKLLQAGWTAGSSGQRQPGGTDAARHPEGLDPLVAIRHDPLVPWALGSRRLTRWGTAARPVILSSPGDPNPFSSGRALCQDEGGFDPLSLHWDLPRRAPFREWLQGHPEVWLVTDLTARESGSPHHTASAWVPQAICFIRGRPVRRRSLLLGVRLARLIASPLLEGVEKAGWDCCGIAMPARLLEHTA